MTAFSYMGTIDDVVQRYPWKFKLTKARLEHSLAVQIITGSPVLLNDGYLTLHPVAQSAVRDQDGLLWAMMKAGYLRIMARGFNRFGLHEMPEKMATAGKVTSFADLVSQDSWPQLRSSLKQMDDLLRSTGHIVPWPSFDAGSGFLVLASQLLRNSTAHSVGLTPVVRTEVFDEFLKRFVAHMENDTRGARTVWEELAKEFASDVRVTRRPKAFVNALMNLGNEMYHYNMGVMLAADHDATVSVETQVSPAFDDLLAPPATVLVEELPLIPRIHVPQVVVTAPASKLVEILEPHRPVSIARERWLKLQSRNIQALDKPSHKELREAGEQYARLLAEHLGAHVSYKEGEGLVNFAIGKLADVPKAAIFKLALIAGIEAGSPGLGAVAGIAAGYLFTRLQSNLIGTVTRKVRVLALKNQILSPELLSASQRAVRGIISRRVPSAIEIDKSRAMQLAARMTRFNPAS